MYIGKSPVPVTLELLSRARPNSTPIARPATIRPDGPRHRAGPRPTWQPSNLTEDRVVQFADGDIFNVITNGRRTMPSYRYPGRGRGPLGHHRLRARTAARRPRQARRSAGGNHHRRAEITP